MKLEVRQAMPADIPRCIEVQFLAFAYSPVDNAVNGVNNEVSRQAAVDRLLREMSTDDTMQVIKVVDLESSKDEIVGYCIWNFYTKPRSKEEYEQPHAVCRCDWIEPAEQREKLQTAMAPVIEGRIKYVGGRPYGLLLFLSVDPAFQRQGAGGLMVDWGLEKCDELGIEAYLEASEFGAPVYYKRGYEKVGKIDFSLDDMTASFPALLRQPRGPK